MGLSKNFALEEFTRSATAEKLGIENKPGESETNNLIDLCVHVLQPIRDSTGRTININSGYRCPALNRAVGGVDNSQHVKGQAADIFAEGMMARELFGYIVKSGTEFDQVILYPTFVHVSYCAGKNRKQVLYAKGVKP